MPTLKVKQGGVYYPVPRGADGAPGMPVTTVDAKGDLIVGTANDAVTRLGVGTDGQVLTADSAEASGLKWAAAAGSLAGAELDLTTDWTTTTPALPSTGVTVFARQRAGRRLPAFNPPSGLDSPLQPGLAFNKIAWASAPGTTNAVPTVAGQILGTANGTATARVVATTNFSTQTKRVAYVSAGTAASMCEYRLNAGQYFLSSTALMGGFYVVMRFINDTNASTSDRMFAGLAPVGAATNVEPSSVVNTVGMGFDAADTTYQFMQNNGSGTATKTDLGANFAKATLTNVYELRMFSVPGSNSVSMSAERLDASGTVVERLDQTTKVPVANTLLAPKIWKTNNATASATAFAFISWYIETDN